MRFKNVTTIILISIFLFLINVTSVVAEPKHAPNSTEIANDFLGRFSELYSEWEGARASNPIPLRNIDGQEVVDVLDVIKGNSIIGYIIIGTDEKISPIVSLGTGEFPRIQIETIYDKVKNKYNDMRFSNPEIIFGGPGVYGIKTDVYKNRETKNKIIDVQTENFSEEFPAFVKSNNSQEKWNKIKNNTANLLDESLFVQPMNVTDSKSLNVRMYDQEDSKDNSTGCGPAAGAMILNYWDERGYTNLQTDSDRTYGINLMNHLFDDMGTDFLGTSYVEWTSGIEKHSNVCESYSFNSWYSIWEYEGQRENIWTQFVTEINSNRPVGLWFPLGANPYSYHVVAGRGWLLDYSYGSRLYQVNTWGGTAWHDFDSTSVFHLMYVVPG